MRLNISYVGSISFYMKCSNFSRAAQGEVKQRKYSISTCQWLFAREMNRGSVLHRWPWGFFGPPVPLPTKNHT